MSYEAARISWQSSEQFARHLYKELAKANQEIQKLKGQLPDNKKSGCWNPSMGEKCDCPACGGFND